RDPGVTAEISNPGPGGDFVMEAYVDSFRVSGPQNVHLDRMQKKEIPVCLPPRAGWDPRSRKIEIVLSSVRGDVSRQGCFCDTVPEGWLDLMDPLYALSFCRLVERYSYAKTVGGSSLPDLYDELGSVSVRTQDARRYQHVSDPRTLMSTGEGTETDIAAYAMCQLAVSGYDCIFVKTPDSVIIGSDSGTGMESLEEPFCTFIEPSMAPQGIPFSVCRDLTRGKIGYTWPMLSEGRDWNILRHVRRIFISNFPPIKTAYP
ncbi:MAG: hypothetical protein J5494_06045, partial [Candidatus Methanomethylophilaceae archaeon]|nr:hypothetical protein [Candidatus Methanomethylophilaceae archaeon]